MADAWCVYITSANKDIPVYIRYENWVLVHYSLRYHDNYHDYNN